MTENEILEKICQQGCRTVNEQIDAMENGKIIPELENLSFSTQQNLLQQLKEIMSVYGNDCALR